MTEEEKLKDPEGSFAAGFLLTFGINLFILIIAPINCGILEFDLYHPPKNPPTSFDIGFVWFALLIGVTQFTHALPTLYLLKKKNLTRTRAGTISAVELTFAFWVVIGGYMLLLFA
jgi:hypothetical protein